MVALPEFSDDMKAIRELRNEFSHGRLKGKLWNIHEVNYYADTLQMLFDFNLFAILGVPEAVWADRYYSILPISFFGAPEEKVICAEAVT